MSGVAEAGNLALGVLLRVAAVVLAIGCVAGGIRIIAGGALESGQAIAAGLMNLAGLVLGALLVFKAPDIAEVVLMSTARAASVGEGPFAQIATQLLTWIQRLGAAVATLGYVWHGTWALIDLASSGGGARAAEVVPKFIGLTLALLALWRAADIVNALSGAFSAKLF